LPRRVTDGEVVTIGIGDVGVISMTLTITGPGVGAVLAYFVVAEALTNVAKHSRASHAKVTVEGHGFPGTLTVMISDDGIGGAKAESPGLSGLADRVTGVDGKLSVHSPAGGPTVIEVDLPCGS